MKRNSGTPKAGTTHAMTPCMRTHLVYTQMTRRDSTTYRVRIGRLTQHADGSFTGSLDALPVNGKLLILPDADAAPLTPIAPVPEPAPACPGCGCGPEGADGYGGPCECRESPQE